MRYYCKDIFKRGFLAFMRLIQDALINDEFD